MAEHKYAQVLRWIADGEIVEARLPGSEVSGEFEALMGKFGEWNYSGDWQACLLRGNFDEHKWEFRIKPKTVKIGNREVDAPVLKPAKFQKVYAVWPDGMQSEWVFRSGDFQHEEMAAAGFFYSTQDAANAAREAITAILTGKE